MSATKGTRPQIFAYEVESGSDVRWDVFVESADLADLDYLKTCKTFDEALMMARRRGVELVVVTVEAAFMSEAVENHEGITQLGEKE